MASPAIVDKIEVSAAAEKEDEEETGGGTVIGDDGNEEWFDVSAAQAGMVRVFERVVEVAAEGDDVAAIGGAVSCRLLVWKNQAGAVIGKGGKVVEKIRKDTGCRIKVLTMEGSSPTDEIVEVRRFFLYCNDSELGVYFTMLVWFCVFFNLSCSYWSCLC